MLERPTPRGIDGALPQALPHAELWIEVLRESARIRVPPEIDIWAPETSPSKGPQRLRLSIRGELLCDEMVLVYGRPLCWTGEVKVRGDAIPYVERIFGQIFSLNIDCPELLTPPPRVRFPEQASRVAWSYGAVLVRGDDPPWADSGLVRIHREL